MPLVISTKSRPTPYLQEYLRALIYRPNGQMWKVGVAGGIFGTLGGLAGAAMGILGGTGVIPMTPMQIVTLAIGIPVATAMGIAGYGYKIWKQQDRGSDAALTKEAKTIAHQILQSVNNRRLYRAMHPAAIDLLEESARCWKRTNDAVNSPFWRERDLPEHYRTLRQQAMTSSERAMMEILINLRSAVRSVPQPQTVIENITAALETVGIQISTGVGAGEPLPVGFEKAAELAKSLAELAGEVEQVSTQVIKASAPISMDSAENIRATLEDLRQIRAAENELDQDLRSGA